MPFQDRDTLYSVKMAQRLVESQNNIETDELFIEETAKLAMLVVEQKENPAMFKSERRKVTT